MCIQTKRGTATDITTLLKNSENLLAVMNHEDEGPSMGDGEGEGVSGAGAGAGILPAIQEENGDSPLSLSSSLASSHTRELVESTHDADTHKKTTHYHPSSNNHANRTHMKLFLALTVMLFIAAGIVSIALNQNLMDAKMKKEEETREFQKFARESIRQAHRRRDQRRTRRREEEEISGDLLGLHDTGFVLGQTALRVNLHDQVSVVPLASTS